MSLNEIRTTMKASRTSLMIFVLWILTIDLMGQEIIKKNLADSINTSYTETKPMISPDGEMLYFARQNYPENINGKYDDQDIYYSEFTYKGWKKAHNIGKPLNNDLP
ncbi:MAG: hypothetical protein R3321_14075, partial [Nitrososphaeraceae archaeon]|nr:hypothetical protein [Nitrososphaeraceae archaeon]